MRDDDKGNRPGRTTFKVLSFIFFFFLLFGIFVAYKLYRSTNVKHSSLYIFYALGLLTLTCKYGILCCDDFVNLTSPILLSPVRVAFFLDAFGHPYLYPNWLYLLLSSMPIYTYLLSGLFY